MKIEKTDQPALTVNKLASQITDLYNRQATNWDLFSDSIKGLKAINTRELTLSGNKVIAQFNPARIKSTAAVIDKKSIEKRACFLCGANRPAEQEQVQIDGFDYSFLVNPYPVLNLHFTVVHNSHILQEPLPYLKDFFYLTEQLGEGWAVVFNGAKAGASAPDHLHFQTFTAEQLPLYSYFTGNMPDLNMPEQPFRYAGMNFMLISAEQIDSAAETLRQSIEKLGQSELLNLVGWKYAGKLICFLIPRSKHRPDCYYQQGEGQILLSPGALELCGVWVFPREQDYLSISSGRLEQIAIEVT